MTETRPVSPDSATDDRTHFFTGVLFLGFAIVETLLIPFQQSLIVRGEMALLIAAIAIGDAFRSNGLAVRLGCLFLALYFIASWSSEGLGLGEGTALPRHILLVLSGGGFVWGTRDRVSRSQRRLGFALFIAIAVVRVATLTFFSAGA